MHVLENLDVIPRRYRFVGMTATVISKEQSDWEIILVRANTLSNACS